MRKVLFKKIVRKGDMLPSGNIADHTGLSDFEFQGFFHGFATEYERFDNGIGVFTVAIIENLNGEVITTHPGYFKFIDLPNYKNETKP